MTTVTKRFPMHEPAMLKNMGKPIEASLQLLRDTNWKGVYELPLFLGNERHIPKADDLTPQPVTEFTEQVNPVHARLMPVRVGTITNFGISQIHGQRHLWLEVEIPREHLHHFEGGVTATVHSAPRMRSKIRPSGEWCYFVRFDRHNLTHHFGDYGDLVCLDPEMIEEVA